MATVIEKIRMLLALAESPYEAEAQSALLKARKLMAEHKLCPEDIGPQKDKRVVRKPVGISSTKLSTPWAPALAGTIATQYCCRHYIITERNRKTVEIGLVGFEDDFNACTLSLCYAYDSVLSYCKTLKKNLRGRYPAATIRQMCDSYGWGFCTGLKAAFEAQTEQHQEWGLVMVVPQEVERELSEMKKTVYAKPTAETWKAQYAAKGYQDGQAFDPARRLAKSS